MTIARFSSSPPWFCLPAPMNRPNSGAGLPTVQRPSSRHRGSSWLLGPCPLLRIHCAGTRRHNRRRGLGSTDLGKSIGGHGYGRDDTSSSTAEHWQRQRDDDNVIITLDPRDIRDRVASAAEAGSKALQGTAVRLVRLGKAVVKDSSDFLTDLRSSISVQRDKRVIISLRRSSVEFAANVLLWSLLAVAVWKVFAKAAKKYRWGWEESYDSHGILRRDRSLGGREVLVGKDGDNSRRSQERQRTESHRRRASPLDNVELLRSEKEMKKQRDVQSHAAEKSRVSLPAWWVYPEPTAALSYHGQNDAQQEATYLVQAITEKRLSGKDFEEADMVQLRRLCRYFGARVKFDTANIRDSFFRAAINFVLSSCGRIRDTGVVMGGEKAAQFLTGLADNLELEEERAATMVNAAVAAQTRSTFLQAWALYVQGKTSEAEEEITRLVRIHALLPPDKDSPEMEMVAQGLGRHLSLDERKHLLDLYLRVGGTATARVASEALGVYSSLTRI